VKPPVVLAVGGIDTGNGAGVESDARAMAPWGFTPFSPPQR